MPQPLCMHHFNSNDALFQRVENYHQYAIPQAVIAQALWRWYQKKTRCTYAHARILELGAGTGLLSQYFYPQTQAQSGGFYIANDASAAMLKKWRANIPMSHHRRYMCHVAHAGKQASIHSYQKFQPDVLIASMSLQWLPQTDQCLARYLRYIPQAYVAVPIAPSLAAWQQAHLKHGISYQGIAFDDLKKWLNFTVKRINDAKGDVRCRAHHVIDVPIPGHLGADVLQHFKRIGARRSTPGDQYSLMQLRILQREPMAHLFYRVALLHYA